MNKNGMSGILIALGILSFISLGFFLGNYNQNINGNVISGMSISEIQNKLSGLEKTMQENEELINQLENSELKDQEKEELIEKLKNENIELRKTILEVINMMAQEMANLNSEISSSPSHSSSSSDDSDDEDYQEPATETCKAKGYDCNLELEYFDPISCVCIDRRPPVEDDPKTEVN